MICTSSPTYIYVQDMLFVLSACISYILIKTDQTRLYTCRFIVDLLQMLELFVPRRNINIIILQSPYIVDEQKCTHSGVFENEQ